MTTPPEPTGPPQPAPPADPPRTFTQPEVDALLAREKRQSHDAAVRQVAEQLGVTVDEAKRIITEHRAQADAQKTEAQRAREAADTAKAEADREKAAAAAERHAARVERALVAAGVTLPDDDTKRDVALARAARLVDAEVGADPATVSAAVAGLKAEMPALFAPAAAGGAPSDPGRAPARPGQAGDSRSGLQRGAELARERGKQPAWSIEGGKITAG